MTGELFLVLMEHTIEELWDPVFRPLSTRPDTMRATGEPQGIISHRGEGKSVKAQTLIIGDTALIICPLTGDLTQFTPQSIISHHHTALIPTEQAPHNRKT